MKRISSFVFALVLLNSCVDLDVDNPGLPNLSNLPVRTDIYQKFHTATQTFSAASIAMACMADQATSSWGEFGARLSDEPRIEYSTATRGVDIGTLYVNLYSSLTYANDILALLEEGAKYTYKETKLDAQMMKAWARFMQGLSIGYLGLCFDKAVLVTETSPENYKTLSAHSEFILKAVSSLDECISICSKTSFTLPDVFINGTPVHEQKLAQMANSFAARILVGSPRTEASNTELPWTTILAYAEKGITSDLEVTTDGADWKDSYKSYGTYKDGWVRVDHRVISLLDPNYPPRWPANNWPPDGDPGPASSQDARLASDFEYIQGNIFNPANGYYHFSHYRFKRFDTWMLNQLGPVPVFRKSENDLIAAEALARTGNLPAAIAVLNTGPRVTRGGLDPLDSGATLQDVLDAIFYERDIDLMFTGMGISFFDMRRRDMLQPGTPLHFPIPFSEQDLLGVTRYTFGGADNADGVNTSNGGWF